jgi:hypothetical protein
MVMPSALRPRRRESFVRKASAFSLNVVEISRASGVGIIYLARRRAASLVMALSKGGCSCRACLTGALG